MNQHQKGFVIPVIIALIVLVSIGGGLYFYKEKMFIGDQKDTIIVMNNNSSVKSEGTTISFSYPDNWYLYRDSSAQESRVHLVKDPSDLEGSFFDEIEAKQKTHIDIGLYTDAYPPELIKQVFNPLKIDKNAPIKNNISQSVTWFMGKDIENWGPAKDDLISSYVITLPSNDFPRTLFVSLRPLDEKNDTDVSDLKAIIGSFKIIERKPRTDNTPSLPTAIPNLNISN